MESAVVAVIVAAVIVAEAVEAFVVETAQKLEDLE